MQLKDKKILVTGASSGIGRAIAIAAAQKGAKVIIAYHTNKKGAEETLEQISLFSEGHIIEVDVCNEESVANLFSIITTQHGALDMLVNNAGDAQPGDIFNSDVWKYQLDNILLSAVRTTQGFLKQESSAALRKILMIGSYYGTPYGGDGGYIAYSAAKAALHNFATTLAKVEGTVLVNTIAPGYTWTLAWEGTSEDDKKSLEQETVIKRFIEPDEIAAMAIALLENDAITGQVITVDGGLSLNT